MHPVVVAWAEAIVFFWLAATIIEFVFPADWMRQWWAFPAFLTYAFTALCAIFWSLDS